MAHSQSDEGVNAMTSSRPTPTQERWLLLAERYRAYRHAEPVISGIAGWRSMSFLTRCAFFVLGLIAAVAASAIIGVMFQRHFAIPAGFVVAIAGELLIRDRRLFAAGIEEALVATGYMLIACGALFAIDEFSHETRALLVVTFALLVTGLRLLNPLFTTLAALVCSFAVSSSMGLRLFYSYSGHIFASLWTSAFCYAIAVVALVLGKKQFQRPSHDSMLDWLVVVTPVAGYLWSAQNIWFEINSTQRLWQVYVTVVPLCFAVVGFVVAIHRRKHAPFFTTMGCVACVAYELRNLSGLPLYGRLIVWGALMLIVATLAERWLRTSRNGISSIQLEDRENVLSVAEMAGAALVTPATKSSTSEPSPTMEGRGGNFGGGGASGKY
jgi:hypothetical protein